MDSTVGTKGLLWGSIGGELLTVVYDMRYMIICSVALILADFWWGYSESRMRLEDAKEIGNATLQDKFKWHKSRAIRRSVNKIVDYMTYLIVGALIGLAITEPMDVCSHIWTAAIGLILGCACEIASIIGHIAYVKFDVEISMLDGLRAIFRFFGRLIKVKSIEIGDAVEGLANEGHHYGHHGMIDDYDKEQNMED